MRSPSNKGEKVHAVENIFEIDMLKDVLETHGFVYAVTEQKDPAYDGLLSSRSDARHSSLKKGTERKSGQ
jgi:hypothetical protein